MQKLIINAFFIATGSEDKDFVKEKFFILIISLWTLYTTQKKDIIRIINYIHNS